MRPQPGVYPRERPRSTGSNAEVAVYESLKSRLPPGWYAWHSLRIMAEDGIFGEGDFVIADPKRGLLALEVKGGNITQRDGRWFQNGVPMPQDPRDQAYGFVHKLIDRLDRDGCSPPAYGVGTCFPDVPFDKPPGQDDLCRTTIGRQDLPWIDERLKILMERALPAPRRPKGRWIERLAELWGDTWIPALGLGTRSRVDETERARLDSEQIRAIQMVERNANVLVEGGAGTGKTLLAREAACRFAAKGERVLLLCFTNGPAEWLRRTITTPDVRVSALGQLALDFMGSAGSAVKEPADKPGWDRLLLEVAADVLPKISRDWRTVILDEAQDLSDVDWELVRELARDKRHWVFHDPAQHFWTDRNLPDWLSNFFHLQLPENHRCAPGIMALANCYKNPATLESSLETIREAIANKTIDLVQCPSESAIPDRIANEIGKLRSAASDHPI
jgi:AAA domain/Nuclease-related domain